MLNSVLTALAVASCVLNSTLGWFIACQSRKGPEYWPALNLCALASGVPGAYLLAQFFSRLVPFLPRFTTTSSLVGYALLFCFCCFLQASAVHRVHQANRLWRRRERLRRALKGIDC